MRTFPCPKCSQKLEQSGEAKIDGKTYPVFQCDDCVVTADFLGEPMEIAYTFALDERGRPFDPVSGDSSTNGYQ